MRIIDADALRALYEKALQFDPHEYIPPSEVIADIDEAPTIDAEPVKHGVWIEHKWAEENEGILIFNYECTVCHAWIRDKSNFCPNCGAKMDGERENHER